MPAVSPEDPFPLDNDQPLNFFQDNYLPTLPGMFSLFQSQPSCSTHEASLWTLAPQLYLGTQADDLCRSDGQSLRVA